MCVSLTLANSLARMWCHKVVVDEAKEGGYWEKQKRQQQWDRESGHVTWVCSKNAIVPEKSSNAGCSTAPRRHQWQQQQ